MTRSGDRWEILSLSEEETLRIGRTFAAVLFPGMTLLLEGSLGAGKTTLVRGIADGLGARNVRSPSFTLMNEYAGYIPIVHVDLYRLALGGGDDLGLEESIINGALLLVEWPDRWEFPPLEDLWHVKLLWEKEGEMGSRKIVVEARGERALDALCKLRLSCGSSEGS